MSSDRHGMDKIDWFVLGLSAGILLFMVFLPPSVGLANNGDFGKLIARFNLGAPFEYEFQYATIKYNFDPKYYYHSGILSPEQILVDAALGLNALVFRDGFVDVRCIGAVHSALFLLIVYLLLPVLRDLKTVVRISLLALLLFIFMDVMYVSWFNSFYMDTGAFLFLLMAATLFLRASRKASIAYATAWLICCILLVATKAQHCLLALPLSVFLLWEAGRLWPRRPLLFKAVGTTCILGAGVFAWVAVPPEYAVAPLYTMIFHGIVNTSSNVSKELAELGLDDSYLRFADTTGYTPGTPVNNPETLKQFTDRTSYRRLGHFFLTHPARTYQITLVGLGEAGRQRPMLGNFDRGSGKPASAETQAFALWSGLKKALFFHHGLLYLLYFLLLSAAAGNVALTRAEGTFVAPACLLICLAWIEMGVFCLGDAADTIRHAFLFNTLLDLLLAGTLAAAIVLPRRTHARPPAQFRRQRPGDQLVVE